MRIVVLMTGATKKEEITCKFGLADLKFDSYP